METVWCESLGRLALIERIGRGGMGLVWRAWAPAAARSFAVKVLAPREPDRGDARRWFDRERRILKEIKHPNVVCLRGDGDTDEGAPFYAMDLGGVSLEHLLVQAGALSLADTVAILQQLLAALSVVHGAGIAHRDVKPGNILVRRQAGQTDVLLIDFGVASDPRDGSFDEGKMVGTCHYMSPEQVLEAATVGPRADLWAAAVVAYECLTGTLPFDGRTCAATWSAVSTARFTPVSALRPDLGPAIDALFGRALQLAAVDRFASAEALSRALLDLLDHVGAAASSPPVLLAKAPSAASMATTFAYPVRPSFVRATKPTRAVGKQRPGPAS